MNTESIAELLPHQPPMVLIERVRDWDADFIECTSAGHHERHHPLRIDGELSVYAGVEYAAQGMAAHARLSARAHGAAPRKGFVAVASKIRAQAQTLDCDPGELRIAVHCLTRNDASSLYRFEVHSPERELLAGQLTVTTA